VTRVSFRLRTAGPAELRERPFSSEAPSILVSEAILLLWELASKRE
jgi:hypothetical protein